MKDTLIRDIEIKLNQSGYSPDEMNRIIHCVIGCLENYEVTERVTDLAVRVEDINTQILKRYVACLRISDKSEGTVKAYVQTLRKLTGKPYTEMKANDIRYYLGTIKMRGCKNSYIKTELAKISAFFRWMTEEEMIDRNPCNKIADVKCEKEILFPYSPVEIDRMRHAIKGRQALRDRAIIEVLLSSGIRREELCNLQIADVDLKTRNVLVRRGKGGKGRMCFMSEIAAEYVSKYLQTRKDTSPYLFIPEGGYQLSVDGVGKMCQRLGRTAGVDNVHPHRFRRTFATTMNKRGMPLDEIQRLMGHSNIQTTLRYIYTDETQLRSAYDKYAA